MTAAEASVIGAMILAPDCVAEATDGLSPVSFTDPTLGLVFAAISAVAERGEPVDVVTIETELARVGHLDRVGGIDRLLLLAAETPTTSHVGRYIAIVREAELRRRLAAAGAEVTQTANSDHDLGTAIAAAEHAVLTVADHAETSTTKHIRDHLHDTLDYHDGEPVDALPTGLTDLDRVTRGLSPQQFVLIGARPGMGKTALAVGVAKHVAEAGRPVLFASLEMRPLDLTHRLIAHDTHLDLQAASHPLTDLTTLERSRWADALGRLADLPLYIDDNPRLTVASLASRARTIRSRHDDLGLIVVDYLQLMSGRTDADNRQVEVAEISRSLKVLAREMNVAVLACSQLSRALEGRTDKRPMLSDLRESGSLEQDADIIAFLYRDEVYNPDTHDRGVAELHVAKHRNGPTDHLRLVWLSHCARFVDGTKATQ